MSIKHRCLKCPNPSKCQWNIFFLPQSPHYLHAKYSKYPSIQRQYLYLKNSQYAYRKACVVKHIHKHGTIADLFLFKLWVSQYTPSSGTLLSIFNNLAQILSTLAKHRYMIVVLIVTEYLIMRALATFVYSILQQDNCVVSRFLLLPTILPYP